MQRWEPRDGTMVAVPGGRWVLAADAVGVDAADLLLMHTREIEKLNTRLALAVAEVKAWRQADLRHDWIRDNTAGGVAATREVDNLICEMNATDADPVLAKMIGGA